MLSRSFTPLLRATYLQQQSMTPLTFTSFLSTSSTSWLHSSPMINAAAAPAGTKSALAQLRKKTGYSLSICKKALGENDQDLALAEKWLKEQAQAQGWAKAQKLQGRNTSQGLLGVKIQANLAAVVELNCETDFVARNEKFVSLLDEIASVCVKKVATEPLGKTVISKDQVAAMTVEEGKTLADLVALNIGQIGENIALGWVTMVKVAPGVKLSGLSHPTSGDLETDKLQYGRYVSLLAYNSEPDVAVLGEGQTDLSIARDICQHIIGMAPSSIEDEEDKENSLLHQAFLLDEELKVGQVVKTSGLELLDFVRVEVGRGDGAQD